jgi:Xaa-Pro aminopeptidase
MLGFETLTFAPYERALIDKDLLDKGEVAWVDAYHAQVAALIGPQLDAEARAWMAGATAPL